jgi:hypothetical protein
MGGHYDEGNYKRHRAIQRTNEADRDVRAYREGAEAKISGSAKINENPYEPGTTAHREWSRGYRKGKRYRGE